VNELRNMCPVVTQDDVHYCGPTYFVNCRKLPIRQFLFAISSSNFDNLFVCKTGSFAFLSPCNTMRQTFVPMWIWRRKMAVFSACARSCGLSALKHHVIHVFLVGAKKQMLRFYTRTIVAGMADKKACRNWSAIQHVRIPMCPKTFPKYSQHTVTGFKHCASPDQAFSSALNPRPKLGFVDLPKTKRDSIVKIGEVFSSFIHSVIMFVVSNCRSRLTGGDCVYSV